MTQEFFEALDACNPNYENYALTILSGEHFGEKALLSAHRLVWTSMSGYSEEGKKAAENDPFILHASDMAGIRDSGILNIAGMELYAELLGKEKRLIICGAGHVSIAMIKMGKMMGCQVTVIEDRPSFANNAKAAGADLVICDDFTKALEELKSDTDCYFIIVTRGHRYDQDCLRVIAGKPHAYIGMMGSKRRVKFVKETLKQEGISPEVLDSVYTPIGLSIGAETPEEIAISVMAEIIEVKNKKKRNFGYPSDILEGILGSSRKEVQEGQKMLCTIIRRKGSAPREIGTKMLVLPDFTCVGTIGGGCAEAEVIQRGRELLLEEDPKALIYHVDLLDDIAAEEGMVCGGVLDVLIEVIS